MAEILGEGGYKSLTGTSINASSSGNNTLITGVAGQTIRVYKLFIVFANTAVDIKFIDGSTDLTGVMSMAGRGSFVLDYDGLPWLEATNGANFILNLSAGVQASGRIYYVQE